MLTFKSAQAVGTGVWTLLLGKIDNKDASLILNADYTKSNKWSLFIKCEIDGGAIFSFEELKENTYQIKSNTLDITSPNVINIDKPIKISSKSLETNEIEENNWDIEYIEPPTPRIPQWKEVGEVIIDKNNNNQNYIKYIFKDKTHYRIYISYGDYTTKENNKNYSWQIINFYYQLDTSVVKSSLWIANNNNNQQTEINIYNNRIMWGMGRDYIFKKLEELQE